MYIIRCTKCNLDFELTSNDLKSMSATCPTCENFMSFHAGMLMELHDLKMTGTVSPPSMGQ